MFETMTAGSVETLNLIIKADVRGSFEALQGALADLGNEEVKVNIVSGGVGGISETDISLAMTSSAIIIGFNARADSKARAAQKTGIEIRYYNVIYDLIDDVRAALSGCCLPKCARRLWHRRGARHLPLSQVWLDCRLYGDRGHGVPVQAYPRTA
ncbi:MAG: hypothetical protein CM15mP74_23810 [Halieaceae bacterium]|nr:MAG: hypothetical protein CM15mP74_23810 [Halieaceae bacterium]